MSKSVTNVYLRKNNSLMARYSHISTSPFRTDSMIIISDMSYNNSYNHDTQRVKTFLYKNKFYRIRYHFYKTYTSIVYLELQRKYNENYH